MNNLRKLTSNIRGFINYNNIKTIERLKPFLYTEISDWLVYKYLINFHNKKMNGSIKSINYYKDNTITKIGTEDKKSIIKPYYKLKLPYTTEEDIFHLYLIKWPSNSQSLIHNHQNMGCIMKIMEGQLEESVYTKELELKTINELDSLKDVRNHEKIGYIDDTIGYHSIKNKSEFDAYTLHLYAGNFKKEIKTFELPKRDFSIIKYFPLS